MIDNDKLARAIAALYAVAAGSDGQWTATDEVIQQAAFDLWAQATCSAEVMAAHLLRAGVDGALVSDFLDLPSLAPETSIA